MEIPAPEGRDRGSILKTIIVVHYCYYYATCVRSTTSSRSLAVVLLTPVLWCLWFRPLNALCFVTEATIALAQKGIFIILLVAAPLQV